MTQPVPNDQTKAAAAIPVWVAAAPSGSGATAQTASATTSTTTGTVAAGSTWAQFTNSGASSATVAGGTLGAGLTITFQAALGRTLGAIAYIATGTTLQIATVV